MRVLVCCCCAEGATVASADSDDMFPAFSGSFPELVSHEAAGTCGVAIGDAFILTTKQFSKSQQYFIMIEDQAMSYLSLTLRQFHDSFLCN